MDHRVTGSHSELSVKPCPHRGTCLAWMAKVVSAHHSHPDPQSPQLGPCAEKWCWGTCTARNPVQEVPLLPWACL